MTVLWLTTEEGEKKKRERKLLVAASPDKGDLNRYVQLRCTLQSLPNFLNSETGAYPRAAASALACKSFELNPATKQIDPSGITHCFVFSSQ